MDNFEKWLAEEFILHTNRNIFLTGNAGTGKTTLLHEIVKKTHKNTIIVAPTGVAAINAGGMTIHSMFQLPITAFLPNNENADPGIFTNRRMLAYNQRIRKERRKVLQQLELLIIDEISMVRADVLDAIDYTLQRIRKNYQPFGGVQVLVIGDLFQLSPVVKDHEWSILQRYYRSMFFFDSYGWRKSNPMRIELKKIYRQDDHAFISILNNIRNGTRNKSDIDVLNENFTTQLKAEGTITLTTHNAKANAINETELRRLDTKPLVLNAKVKGKFSESAYPTKEVITLKKGAQVMFIRNDAEGNYFNGKIGVVTGKVDDIIFVKCEGEDFPIEVTPTEWVNSEYSLDEKTNEVTKKDIGEFIQYPIKLAWAVTVHKSQGLTFDHAIVDLADTFAPGQLYVALSRCRSLNGLKLSSLISERNIMVDQRVKDYYELSSIPKNVEQILAAEKVNFERHQILKQFNFENIDQEITEWEEMIKEKDIPKKADVVNLSRNIKTSFSNLQNVCVKFRKQLISIFNAEEIDEALLKDRLDKSIGYFAKQLHESLALPLDDHILAYKPKTKTKTYLRSVQKLLDEVWLKINQLYRLCINDEPVYTGEKIVKKTSIKPEEIKKKKAKGETYRITHNLFLEGNDIDKIAQIRSMARTTIEGHFARLIEEQKIDITQVMDSSRIEKIKPFFIEEPELHLNDMIKKIPFTITYGELRMVRASLDTKQGA